MHTPLIVKIYVINPKAFPRYLERGNATSIHPFGHEQYPSNNIGQNDSTHGVLQNTPMRVLVSRFGFGRVMQ